MISKNSSSGRNLILYLDIVQQRLVELPVTHPLTKQVCQFNTASTPTYPRNSYDIDPPPDRATDECWWPDGLNEIDARPRNMPEDCRRALKHVRSKTIKIFLPNLFSTWDTVHGETSNDDFQAYKEIFHQQVQLLRRQEKARARVERTVHNAIGKRLERRDVETLEQDAIAREAKKEFKSRQTSFKSLQAVLKTRKWSNKYKNLVTQDYMLSKQELSVNSLDQPWANLPSHVFKKLYGQHKGLAKAIQQAEASAAVGAADTSTRRLTIHEIKKPNDTKFARANNEYRKNQMERLAAMDLYQIWEDSPLGVPDDEDEPDETAWVSIKHQVKRLKKRAPERQVQHV